MRLQEIFKILDNEAREMRMSATALAKLAGTTRQYMSHMRVWARGEGSLKNVVPLRYITAIAGALGYRVVVDYQLEKVGDPGLTDRLVKALKAIKSSEEEEVAG